MKPQVLLSGASGLIGTALREAFVQQGYGCRQLVRHPARTPEEIEWHPSSGKTPDANRLQGTQIAIHLSGANISSGRWTEARKRELLQSRVVPTRALAVALCQTEPRSKVLVCASAIGIYGERGDEVVDESSAPGQGFLPETCLAWEASAAEAAACGIRVVSARFGIVLSPKGGALAKMLPLFRLGLGGPLGNGREWMSWISLEDTARALVFLGQRAIDDPSAPLVEAVNVVAPNPVRNADFTRQLGHALHRPAILPAPAFALRLVFGEMADQALLASTRVAPTRLQQKGFEFHHPTLAEALRHELQ
uniref:TIGR01777 family protein n=1 Tax=Acidobacterium capsulatum TaxID=33075 RepID=A0A7V4XTU7_9BACT